MELEELQRHWNALGQSDPLWAIIAMPDKKNGRWKLDEFFEHGRTQINYHMEHFQSIGLQVARARALDFGCGVGRLTQALCRHFQECHGVDIAPAMLRLARRHNQFGARCRYHLNAADDLGRWGDHSFTFVCSIVVLQHMKPEFIRRYIQEFLRVLAPGGHLFFQLPSRLPYTPGSTFPAEHLSRNGSRRGFKERIRQLLGLPGPDEPFIPSMQMYAIEKQELIAFIESQGATVVDVLNDASQVGVDSYFYTVAKAAGGR